MNFRKFFRLHEVRNYVLMKTPQGKYKVIGPKSTEELPSAMQSATVANKPVGIWSYNITGGRLYLPQELEKDREQILQAHYSRMGYDIPESPPEREEEKADFSDIIDPSVFNPNYERDHELWKKYKAQQYLPQLQQPGFYAKPGSSGEPTLPP